MPLGLYTASLNFETLKEIGQEGKNSKVYIAHDKQLDGEIVVKKIQKIKIPNASEYYNESKLLYNSSHQNIVRVNYGCEDSDHIYIAMPYYKNGSLKSLIDSRFLSIREVVRYSIQFLSGLNHIHTKGLLHFDVKPDNILLSNSNEALLSDFGLTKAMDRLGFAEQEIVYPKQVPPEKFTQTKFSIQYDIYLAGLTLYRLCNGNNHYNRQFTFKTQNDYVNAILRGDFPNRDFYLPHIPKKLQKIINKALHIDPAKRHNNVLELINEIGAIDSNLDWEYKPNPNGHLWELHESEKFYTVELLKNNNNFDIFTYKTMISSGRRTRVNDNCFSSIDESKIHKSLEKALKNLN
jgi:eukaryotic-like serine/threonine-protein kinase